MNYLNNTWINNYQTNPNYWLSDSLTYETTDYLFSTTITPLTSLITSSFTNQHFLTDIITKVSYYDTLLVNTSSALTPLNLYIATLEDLYQQHFTYFLPLNLLLQSDYQDNTTMLFVLAPETVNVLIDYTNTYVLNAHFSVTPSTVFDSYVVNEAFLNAGVLYFIFYTIYIWVLINTLLITPLLRWVQLPTPQFFRNYYYITSVAKEIRLQIEVVIQTLVFFAIYWVETLMTFDDNQEEVIELVDTSFFYFFVTITFYLCYKYSTHYFTFLEASVAEGRTVSFITKQVFKDFLNTISLFLRFYILLLRVNVYDTLDDFLDSYYIFVGDFDEDEYLNELFLSLTGSLLFLSENDYDTSYLYEDEHDFFTDLYYLYFISWGKFFYFTFFMLEEAARLSLAFYVCYLITFEVHSVNCSYNEDSFMVSKRK